MKFARSLPQRGVSTAALVGLLALAACGRHEPPAPVDIYPASRSPGAAPGTAAVAPAYPPAAPAPQPRLGARDTVYVVERGDTAYAVARRFDIPVKSIIDANNLQPPYGVVAGQRLAIPQPRAHLVVAGDTVQSVSHRYGVDVSALVRANDLPPPYALRPGQRLALPASVAGTPAAPQVAVAPPPALAAAASPAPPTSGARAVEVAALAAPSGPPPRPSAAPVATPVATAPPPAPPAPAVAAAAPAPVAPPKPPTALAVDKPAAPPAPAPAPVAPPPPAAAAAQERAPEPTTERPPQLAAVAVPKPEDAAPAATPAPPPPTEPPAVEPTVAAPPHDTTPVGPPPPRAGKTFLWPLRGRVIATYGEQGRGLHNDGINIAAPRGTPIRAAENGVVAYAGNEIRGFGNLLLIRHAGGYMTAYAHADTLLVKRGDTVHRGQTIARVGATGSVTEPQLHFEIREGSQPVDPQRFLGSPSA